MHNIARFANRRLTSILTFGLFCAGTLAAQVVAVPSYPVVGSSNPVSAEPTVTRPGTTPCVVTLLKEQSFIGFDGVTLAYTPPSGCAGPWAKVVFSADFTVTAGRQFDRTAEVYLGSSNIYFGTTAEPRRALSPSWHVERDVTDLSAIFKTAQAGRARIDNVVDGTYTGVIYANASLIFYPASRKYPAPVVPDVVVPVSGTNDPAYLYKTTDKVTQTLNLPRNVEKVYLDLISQSQSGDEFWYLCVPDSDANALETCGGTAFRETEVSIDGKAAGVAPVYPWIYTGGIDPYLWEPTVGVQTLNFKPYRVDLTPFAGVLADGAAHTVAVSVYGANSYFAVTANLLAYTDHEASTTGGALVSNTLGAAPVPALTDTTATDSTGTTTGTVAIGSNRTFTASGYVMTSHGKVTTTVNQTVKFLSTQTFNVNAATEIQNLVQTSTVDSTTTAEHADYTDTDLHSVSFPLTLNYSYVVKPDNTSTQVVTSTQGNQDFEATLTNGSNLDVKGTYEQVQTTDSLPFTASGALAAAGTGSATEFYWSSDSQGGCYSRSIASTNQQVTSYTDGVGCKKGR